MSTEFRFQNTIKNEVSYKGIGLHSGEDITIKLKPAQINKGIVFKRVDLKESIDIEASLKNVVSTNRSTAIGKDKITIQTIEHMMAALMAYNIDNILIEINGSELPAADGSAKPFSDLINTAGIKKQNVKRKIIEIKEPINYKNNGKYFIIFPSKKLKISYLLDYNHPYIGTQYLEYEYNKESFINEIIPARTFGLDCEVKRLKNQGLALGGSLDNAVLIKDDGIVNKLRYEDEFVRHKILDLLGDLYLNGPIRGEILAVKTGHSDNYNINNIIKDKINSF